MFQFMYHKYIDWTEDVWSFIVSFYSLYKITQDALTVYNIVPCMYIHIHYNYVIDIILCRNIYTKIYHIEPHPLINYDTQGSVFDSLYSAPLAQTASRYL